MDYRLAGHAELFTAAEKDERYLKTWIEDDVQEIAQRCLGVRRWVQFRSAISVLTRLGYFAINSLENLPSPGEEFCETRSRATSLTQQLMSILLNNDLQLPKEIPRPLVNIIKDVHMITYFFFGDFYRISDRIAGVNHVAPNVGERADNSRWAPMNKLIGCMSLFRLMLDLPRQAEALNQSQNLDQNPDIHVLQSVGPHKPVHPDAMCQLCSSKRTEPTSTLCGHIFCWCCIHNWLKERNECPICRMPTEPSRLIHLINFR